MMAFAGSFVLGMLNGITPAIRTTVYEVCGTNEHVVQAMAYIDGEGTPEGRSHARFLDKSSQ